jgi:putative transposase
VTTYDQNKHHRRSIRLRGYDYSQPGAYYVTITTRHRACLFGDVVNGAMRLNDGGRVAKQCWMAIPDHFPHTTLDAYVIMPNHVHGIIVIAERVADIVGANNYSPLQYPQQPPEMPPPAPFRSPSKTIGSMVRGFKIGVTKWFRANTDVYTVWQRNYYDHVIRDERSLNRIRWYILENPARWHDDRENPDRRDHKP